MKAARLALLALACTLPLAATAQWQWLDKSGRKVFSDQAPPADVPTEKILKGPKGSAVVPAATQAAATPVAAAASAAAPALPKAGGKDKALEDRKKQAEAAENEKKKAEEQKVAQERAANCERAKSAKAGYDSGVRLARVNAKGEREIIDDETRARESKRLDQVIAADCAK